MFDAMLLETGPGAMARKWWTLPAVMGLHVFVVGLTAAASYVVVQAVQDPDVFIVFESGGGALPAPPPGRRPEGPKPATPVRDTPKPAPGETQQPRRVDALTDKDLEARIVETNATTGDGPDNGVIGAVDLGGDGSGSGWRRLGDGLLGEGGDSTDDASNAPPVVITSDITPPVLVTRIEPEYPEAARRARIQGHVILQAVIGETGAVENLKVLRSIPLLDEAALAAVRRWMYRPARLDSGRPIRVFFTVNITFKLE